jgi:hypothetical protein
VNKLINRSLKWAKIDGLFTKFEIRIIELRNNTIGLIGVRNPSFYGYFKKRFAAIQRPIGSRPLRAMAQPG